MKVFELFNEVGEEKGITVDQVRSFLAEANGEDIRFDISTLGGDLSTGITINSLIRSYQGKTTANIVGLTASAGTVIAIACDEITMSDNALFLIHNSWRDVSGNVFELQRAASDLMKYDAIMVKMYREKTGLPDNKIKDLMKASDWLSPEEAMSLGFVDKINKSVTKIAANIIETAATKLNNQLIIKLQEKMKIFGKDKKVDQKLNVLALKDGKNLLINAEVAATGVEVAPLGAATLEDGEFELADGRKIIVAGGVITEVKEVEEPEMASAASEEEILGAVAKVVASEMAKIEAKFDAKLDALKAVSSKAVPPKGVQVSQASVSQPISSKIEEVTGKIFEKLNQNRKA
jgi:ATP-dependent Clp protease, protease subunit